MVCAVQLLLLASAVRFVLHTESNSGADEGGGHVSSEVLHAASPGLAGCVQDFTIRILLPTVVTVHCADRQGGRVHM